MTSLTNGRPRATASPRRPGAEAYADKAVTLPPAISVDEQPRATLPAGVPAGRDARALRLSVSNDSHNPEGSTMTDQQLLEAGERLYKSFLSSKFTFLELAGLAAAREQRTPWEQLGQHLKIAIFRLVVSSQAEESSPKVPASESRPTVVAAPDVAP